ncbi:hypothetical protein [Sporolactobacillus spathodeae]|uniref:TniQ protein n=1 Tax=Sporolactobacillus spathodeae TaxID=1465502 RepID=A0ABS2QAF6_9BACL|nr:hypothetical protein [Sporolactobacillus spathodeae]MBM7657957.1 hypothetical protein [Sporolactobacillus spathodeae]
MEKENVSSVTWKNEWIQPYESIWGILEKFRYANKLETIEVIRFFANKDLRKKRNINPTVKSYRNLISFSCFDGEKTKKVLGLDLCEYYDKMINQLLQPILNPIAHREKYFRENLTFCPICIETGYHSFFHQIKLFDKCVFHGVSLENTCRQCHAKTRYELSQSNDPFCCKCKHPLTQNNTFTFIMTWSNNYSSKNLYTDWINFDRETINDNYLYYPFLSDHDKNENHSELRKALILFQHTHNNDDKESNNQMKSKGFIFTTSNVTNLDKKIRKHNAKYLKLQKSYDHQKYVYDLSKAIYKSVARFIRKKLLKDHKKCIKIFQNAAHGGDVCPDAFAYLLWRKEAEQINELWEVESGWGNGSTLKIRYNDHDNFSFYFGGVISIYIDDTFNNFRLKDFSEIEDKEILNWLLFHMSSDLLIGRFLYWKNKVSTELFHKPLINRGTPFYLALVPKEGKKKMVFIRRLYHVSDISSKTCPIHNHKREYERYINPLERGIQKLYAEE